MMLSLLKAAYPALLDNLMTTDPRLLIAARNAGLVGMRTNLPRPEYLPPPVNPRELPAWYDRWYRAQVKWVEETTVQVSQTGQP